MTLADIETCVRRRIHFMTIIYNDNSLSLIKVAQEDKGYPSYGVEYGTVNFASVAEALGAWARHVTSLDEFERAVHSALQIDRPVLIDVPIDPIEYRAHNSPTVTSVPLAMLGSTPG